MNFYSTRYLAYIFSFIIALSTNQLSALSIGDSAPQFSHQTIEGTTFSLNSAKGSIVVLEWTNPSSPYSTKYYSKATSNGEGYIQSLQKRFVLSNSSVIWITIAPIPTSSTSYLTPQQWTEKLTSLGAKPTALILDESGMISKLYSVSTTPEVCIIDKAGVLVYRGAIDSIQGTEPSDIEKITNLHWFETALENTVKGRHVYTSETIPYGTRIETPDDKSLFF